MSGTQTVSDNYNNVCRNEDENGYCMFGLRVSISTGDLDRICRGKRNPGA